MFVFSLLPLVDFPIANFRKGTGPSPWSLDRAVVADRLTVLTSPDGGAPGPYKGPRTLDQDSLNLCGVAAFFYLWLKRDPAAVVQYGIDLYEKGTAAIGTLAVTPHDELLQQSHRTMWPADIAADLMMMSALRDSENKSGFRFRGRQNEEAEGITTPDEIATWLRATGQYTAVVNKMSSVGQQEFAVAETLLPDPNTRDIVVLLHTRFLTDVADIPDYRCRQAALVGTEALLAMVTPNHYVVLDTEIKLVSTKVSFSFWCWGDYLSHPSEEDKDTAGHLLPVRERMFSCMPYSIKKNTFKDNFYGAIIAVK
jgi:hypothetical protein